MITQIYTMQTVEEALAVAEAGVDYVGVTPSDRGLPGEIDFARAREIVEALDGKAQRVALSVEGDPDAILEMVTAVHPDVVHLCGDIAVVTPDVVRALRPRLQQLVPGIRILQAIPMTGPEALDHARAFYDGADMLILDSVAPHIGGIGAAGVVHDWSISRSIVEQSPLPVILAGGLGPHNVAEAIKAVGPWGVDSLTKTNKPHGDTGFRKDIAKVTAFVDAARKVPAHS